MKLKSVLIMAAFLAALFCFPLTASADCDHDWEATGEYEQIDGDYHQQWYECWYCGTRELGDPEPHYYEDDYDGSFERCDATYHYRVTYCVCGAEDREKEYHDYQDTYYCEAVDETYHGDVYECFDCGRTKIMNKSKHDWAYDYVSRYATLFKYGRVHYYCYDCYEGKYSYPSWKRGSDFSVSYSITDHSHVYKSSKSMNVWLYRPLKGGVIKVKIGNKTYKKRITNSKKKQKVKIKKSKYGKKITVKLYYKGKLVGTDRCDGYYVDDHVLYGKNIRKGMTKKQVKCSYYWGPPNSTSSASGGWTFWHYNDGSYIDFKKGKVKYWYDASR